ncbi:hypothetical protein V2J09_010351 [Rumex salicifolius]
MNPSNKTLTIILLSSLLMTLAAPISGCGHCHRKKGKSPKGPPVLPSPPAVSGGKPGPSPSSDTCPIDALKLGACVDLLGGLVHIGLGNPVVNECCPVLQGLAEVEAAVCLCTTLKLNLLNLNIFVPIALQLLVTCGKSPPPGFTCTLSAVVHGIHSPADSSPQLSSLLRLQLMDKCFSFSILFGDVMKLVQVKFLTLIQILYTLISFMSIQIVLHSKEKKL